MIDYNINLNELKSLHQEYFSSLSLDELKIMIVRLRDIERYSSKALRFALKESKNRLTNQMDQESKTR